MLKIIWNVLNVEQMFAGLEGLNKDESEERIYYEKSNSIFRRNK